MKVGDMVRWFDTGKTKRIGIIVAALGTKYHDAYYDVLVDGKIMFCHKSNMEVLSESR
jgi:hypothetical protein